MKNKNRPERSGQSPKEKRQAGDITKPDKSKEQREARLIEDIVGDISSTLDCLSALWDIQERQETDLDEALRTLGFDVWGDKGILIRGLGEGRAHVYGDRHTLIAGLQQWIMEDLQKYLGQFGPHLDREFEEQSGMNRKEYKETLAHPMA